MKILEYIREDGSNPYQKWFKSLDAQAAAKVGGTKKRRQRDIDEAIALSQEYKTRKKMR